MQEEKLTKSLTMLQCYRLKEKYQYVQLLKSQTSCSLAPNNQQKPKELQGSSTIPVIDLTEDENNYGSIEFNAHSLIDVPPENDELVDIVKAENIQTAGYFYFIIIQISSKTI